MTIAPERPVTRVIPKPAKDWDSAAACRPGMTQQQLRSACLACPVRVDCFRAGYHDGDRDTYRAGMTGDERDQWLTDHGIPLPGAPAHSEPVRPSYTGKRYDVDLDDVARLRAAGQSWREIGHRYGGSPETVATRWRKSGRPSTGKVRIKRRDFTVEIDPAALKTYIAAGASVRRMAVAFGVDPSTVQRHIDRAREAGLL